MTDVEQAKAAVEEGKAAIKELKASKSDLSVAIRKLMAWLKGTDTTGWGAEAMHTLLHFLIDTVIPYIKTMTPTSVDLVISLLTMVLKKFDEEHFHPETPT